MSGLLRKNLAFRLMPLRTLNKTQGKTVEERERERHFTEIKTNKERKLGTKFTQSLENVFPSLSRFENHKRCSADIREMI